jgi:hypothetical protein
MQIEITRNTLPLSPDAPVLPEIVRRLVAAHAPERIYLFGSVAREERLVRMATTI